MKRLNIPLIADTLLIAVCSFLLFFTALRYYTKSAVLGLVFGIAACLLFGVLGFVYISRKQHKSLLISDDEKHKKLLALHLSLSSDGYILKTFLTCLGERAVRRGKRVECEDTLYFFNFKMQALSEDDIAAIIKVNAKLKKCVLCNAVSPEAYALAEYFEIAVKCIDDVYLMMKERGVLPEKYAYEGVKKQSLLKRIKQRFNKKLCPPLFWSGCALLGLSYFTFFPVYYIVSGGILLVLCLAALAVG